MEWDKWTFRFIEMAKLVASWSKDPSTKVGAVIVDGSNRVVSLGYNGFPAGVHDDHDILVDRDRKIMRTIHAEENAIIFSKQSLQGCSIYVTHPPCAGCAAKIIQTGIASVAYASPSDEFLSRWQKQYDEAIAMFYEAGLIVESFR
jgi:dCMP deaminase